MIENSENLVEQIQDETDVKGNNASYGNESDIKNKINKAINIDKLRELILRITKAIDEEYQYLCKGDVKKFYELQNTNKNKLVKGLEAYKKLLKQNPEIKNNFNSDKLKKLKEEVLEFESLLNKYHHALNIAKRAGEVFINAYSNAVLEYMAKDSSYNNKGEINKNKIDHNPLAFVDNA